MKSKLLKAVCQQDTIEKAWRVIQANARDSTSEFVRKEIEKFEEEAGRRVRSICYRLSRNRFEFGKAKGIPLPKKDAAGRTTGKFRPIVLASVEARIVQRSVLEVLVGIPALKEYISTPYSFGGIRKGKTAETRSKRDNPAAVPAAIRAVLDAIEGGAQFYVCADIKSFFTRISKPLVTGIIGSAVNDPEFLAFLVKAINTELSNMAELRERANDFPIQDIGVAQGNSLSPLLGNIALAEFDRQMNDGDCRCIRYIDDFIILAPSAKAANAKLRKAASLLARLGMELSPEKSSKGAAAITDGFPFLGIDLMPGIIRPSDKAQKKFLRSIAGEFGKTRKAFVDVQNGKPLKPAQSLISTLKRAQGMVDGWGKHYWFWNDVLLFGRLDLEVDDLVRSFVGAYSDLRSKVAPDKRRQLFGMPTLADPKRQPYDYPKVTLRRGRVDRE